MQIEIQQNKNELKSFIDGNLDKLRRALPANINPDRFRQAALIAAAESPKVLAQCSPASIFTAIMQAAERGFNLGSSYDEAYLVPYRNRDSGEIQCKLTPGYKGLRRALIRAGLADAVHASLVCVNDRVRICEHPPAISQEIDPSADRGDWLGVLAAAYKTVNGRHELIDFVYLEGARIEEAKAAARSPKIWNKHPEQMWLKTGVRALCQLFPLVNDELRDASADEEAAPQVIEVAPALPESGGAMSAKLLLTGGGAGDAKSEDQDSDFGFSK